MRHAHYFVKLFEYEYAQIFQNVNSVAKNTVALHANENMVSSKLSRNTED